MRMIRKLSLPSWSFPIFLLGICFVSFGLFLPELGFYWDDWAKILVSRVWGLSGYWAYYAEDRPLSGWTHIVLTFLLGNSPLAWQVFVFVLRWLSAVAAWWLVRLLFPNSPRTAVVSALLFLVYPAFTQQPIAVTFHQQWMQYAFILASFACTLQALRSPRLALPLHAAALMLSALQLSITEYFAPLEALRLLLIYFFIQQEESGASFKKTAWKTAMRWLPYFLLLAAYLVWRLFFIDLTGDDPYHPVMLDRLASQPLSAVKDLLKIGAIESFHVLVSSWSPALDIGAQQVVPPFTSLSWKIGAVSGLLVFLALSILRSYQEDSSSRRWILPALAVGFAGLALGCLPAWISGRSVLEDFHANRYAMPAMFGASLVWSAALEWLVPQRLQKAALLAALSALAIVLHLQTTDSYRQIWKNQLDFFWQLAWRAPSIQPVTAILSEEELFPNQGGFSTSAALNLLYPQPQGAPHLAYWFYGMQPRFSEAAAPLGIPLKTQFRTLTFEGKTPDSLLVYYDPLRANCLWVLSEQDANNPDLPSLTRRMLPASSLGRILPQPSQPGYPPQVLFGEQPDHTWCYYFQKADLARQTGNWQEVDSLADEARTELGYTPVDSYYKTPVEWLPFIEGYTRLGRWDDAAGLMLDAGKIHPKRYRTYLCQEWERFYQASGASPAGSSANQRVLDGLGCK